MLLACFADVRPYINVARFPSQRLSEPSCNAGRDHRIAPSIDRAATKPKTKAARSQSLRSLSVENPLWGAPRIHAELMKLSIKISEASVAIAHASISPWIKIRQTHGPVQSVGRIIACREIGGLHHRYERVA